MKLDSLVTQNFVKAANDENLSTKQRKKLANMVSTKENQDLGRVRDNRENTAIVLAQASYTPIEVEKLAVKLLGGEEELNKTLDSIEELSKLSDGNPSKNLSTEQNKELRSHLTNFQKVRETLISEYAIPEDSTPKALNQEINSMKSALGIKSPSKGNKNGEIIGSIAATIIGTVAAFPSETMELGANMANKAICSYDPIATMLAKDPNQCDNTK